MRSFDITDLHDYYDFNFAIESRCDAIVERVSSGQYRADPPLIYREEKKLGICRHLMVPVPSDALVFQLLTDSLYPAILRAQPSKGAYYARARHVLKLPHEHGEAKSYPWFVLWPKFQKEILKFSKAHRYLVTTDLTNYFDNIGLREMRHVISAIVRAKEVYLDLLFSLIEDLCWTPDYLPRTHKGLPIINIEAPRLLAHAFLFEVDHVLTKRTRNSFVRWMDDINFGVADIRSAKSILGEVNDVLKSRGLALNLAKTELMTSKEAEYHFMFRENLRLDRLQKRVKKLKRNSARIKVARRLQTELSKHLKHCEGRNRDKITKRFLSILGSLGVPVALSQAKSIYVSQPRLRASVLNYFSRLPFRKSVSEAFYYALANTEPYDDSTRFGFIAAVIRWPVPHNSKGQSFISKVRHQLKIAHSQFEWLCRLVFLCKYGRPYEVLNTVAGGSRIKDSFFARQRTAALTRGLAINPRSVKSLWDIETSTGSSDSASVANNLLNFSSGQFPARKNRLYLYLFPKKRQEPYPLPKFLLLCCLAHAEAVAKKQVNRPEVAFHVQDPWYRHWLEQIQPFWF